MDALTMLVGLGLFMMLFLSALLLVTIIALRTRIPSWWTSLISHFGPMCMSETVPRPLFHCYGVGCRSV